MPAIGRQLLQHLTRLVQVGNVLAQARKEGLAAQPVRAVGLVDGGQMLAMLAETGRTEQFGPDRRLNRRTKAPEPFQGSAQ